ncbi:Asp/Glu/Hydantoin racemase-domain-containing protein [Trametes polyzona]|nr:Asp/Glu/Hydantoin racemase-domain-containing protein [Trametes polyzona]
MYECRGSGTVHLYIHAMCTTAVPPCAAFCPPTVYPVMAKVVSIAIINPNSSQSMTTALEPILDDLLHPGLQLHYHTGPAGRSPPSVNDSTTSVLSAAHTFEAILPLVTGEDGKRYDAYLVACFSDHPLVGMLREHTPKPVLGIFEASVVQALALGQPFGIVTTGQYWEGALTAGVQRIFGSTDLGGAFVGVQSTGLTARELHDTERGVVTEKIADATSQIVSRGARTIIMGCAGMSGMAEAVHRGGGNRIRVVDAVRSGITVLEGLVRAALPSTQ